MSHIDHFGSATVNQTCNDSKYDFSNNFFFFVPLLYGLPTLVLYIHIIGAIFRNSLLRNEFYKLYLLYCILTTIMWVWDMATTRFLIASYWCQEMLNIWGDPHYYLTPVQFVMTYSRHAQFYAATVLALNRMTAVVYPFRYSKIWKEHLHYAAFTILFLPLATTWYLVPAQTLMIKDVIGGLVLTYVKFLPNPWNSVTALTAFLGTICSVVIIMATIRTSLVLRRLSKEKMLKTTLERSQFIIGTVSSVTVCFLAAVEMPMYILDNFVLDTYGLSVCQCIKDTMIDVLFVFSPWATMFVSPTMRQILHEMYFTPKVMVVKPISSSLAVL